MNNLAYQLGDTRDEMLCGKIVLMSTRPTVNHNIVCGNVFHIFRSFLDQEPCMPFSDGVDVYLSETDRVIPDVMIVCNTDIIKQDGIHGAPDLIVEVLSPSTAKNDRGYKKELYANAGVTEYWIVDTANRAIEVYLLANGLYVLDDVHAIFPDIMPYKLSEEEQIHSSFTTHLFGDLVVSLDEVFKRIF